MVDIRDTPVKHLNSLPYISQCWISVASLVFFLILLFY